MSKHIQAGLPCLACDSSNAMADYGNSYYCFSCHTTIYKKEKKKREPKPRTTTAIHPKYINTFTKKLPQAALAYLYKHHFTDEIIEKYPIMWCNNYYIYSSKVEDSIDTGPRLVFNLIKHDNTLEAKRFGDHPIKYLTHGPKKACIKDYEKEYMIIVEDLLSFFRLINLGYSTCCLRGTQLTDETLLKLQKVASKFIIWLDGDKPGKKAAEKIQKRLHFIGESSILKTILDPKCYSDVDIQTYVSNHNNNI